MSLLLKNTPVLEEALHTYKVFLAREAFDHGGWWTVLAWVAVHTHLQDTLLRAIDGLKRYEAAATTALAYAERLKARVAELDGR